MKVPSRVILAMVVALAASMMVATASAATAAAPGQCDTNPLVCGVIACCPSFFLPTGYYCAITCLPFAEEKAAVSASIAAAVEAPVPVVATPVAVATPVESTAVVAAVAAPAAVDPCGAMECGMAAACCPSIFSPIGYYCALACIGDAKMSSIATSKLAAASPKKSAVAVAAPKSVVSIATPKSAKAAVAAATATATDPCGAFPCGMAVACCPTVFSPFGYYCALACIGEEKVASAVAAAPKLQLAPHAPTSKSMAAHAMAAVESPVESAVSSILGVPVSAASTSASASASAVMMLAVAATAAVARRIF